MASSAYWTSGTSYFFDSFQRMRDALHAVPVYHLIGHPGARQTGPQPRVGGFLRGAGLVQAHQQDQVGLRG